MLNALAHQDYPFIRVVENLKLRPDPCRSPVFQCLFNLHNIQSAKEVSALLNLDRQGDPVDFGGLLFEPYFIPQEEGQFELALEMVDIGETLLCSLRYNKDLIRRETAEHLRSLFEQLLEQILANPDCRIPNTLYGIQSMELTEFLAFLHNQDIQISVDQDHLKVNAPAGTMTPEVQAELLRRKPELIELLQSIQKNAKPVFPKIQHLPDILNAPLSFSQQRFWFLNQFDPLNTAYYVSVGIEMNGDLNVPALSQAISEIIRRHTTLRTVFRTADNNQPVQIILDHNPFHLEIIDLQAMQGEQGEKEARLIIEQQMQVPFNLDRGRLIGVTLFRFGLNRHWLFIRTHHIVSDGWSMGVFIRELQTLYQAFQSNQPSPLMELDVQYVDYAVWQHKWFTPEAFRSQLDFWTHTLKGPLPVLELPADHPRPNVLTDHGARQRAYLPPHLIQAIKQISGEHESKSLCSYKRPLPFCFSVILDKKI